ncbi:MAG: CRISPR-associated protein Csx15 [Armatimonadota bacterium]|nr:CRISPR-associated protein Csx15 [Armatimonadota bacterium]
MIILNFSHPLTSEHLAQIEKLTGRKINKVMDIESHINTSLPLHPQIVSIIDSIPLTPTEWQTEQLLINPPSLNYSAVVLTAELHGRMGYFPTILRLRPVPNATPTVFEVAEVLNLNEVRNTARSRSMHIGESTCKP